MGLFGHTNAGLNLTNPVRRRLTIAFQALAASVECDLWESPKLRKGLGAHIGRGDETIYQHMTRIPVLVRDSPDARTICIRALGILRKSGAIDEIPPEWQKELGPLVE
jgi:hypothetical protein